MVMLKGGTAAGRILAFQTPSIFHAPRQASSVVRRTGTVMHLGREGGQVSLGPSHARSFAGIAAAATAWTTSPGAAMAADSVQSALAQAPVQDIMMTLGVLARPGIPPTIPEIGAPGNG